MTTTEKLLLVYIVHPAFLKGGSEQYSSLIKKIGFEEKVNYKSTCCAKVCIPYEKVKGVFRKTLLNKKLFKHCKIRSNYTEIR